MIKLVFSVFDSKARVYSSPFMSARSEIAVRDFTRAVNDPALDICKFPNDFSLVELGTFDDETGIIRPYDVPTSYGSASLFKE